MENEKTKLHSAKFARIALALFSIIIFSGISHAQSGYEDTSGFERAWCDGAFALPHCSSGGTLGWGYIALLASFVVFFSLALIYMLAYGLQLEGVKRFAVAEFYEFGASTLMIVFVTYLLFASTGADLFGFISGQVIGTGSTAICGGRPFYITSQGGPIEFAKCSVQDKITQLDRLYDRIYDNNMKVETWASACVIIFGVQVFCGDWVVHSIVEQAHLLGEKIVPLQISLHGQYVLLDYIAANMLSIFLPLGIMLRVLPITRGVGGLLIATAIGFYFVFPIVYVLTDPSFVRADETLPSPITAAQACFASFSGATSILNSFILPTMGAAELSYANIAQLLAQLTITLMFYPFVAFAVTIIFIRSLTPVLGGDASDLPRMVAKLV